MKRGSWLVALMIVSLLPGAASAQAPGTVAQLQHELIAYLMFLVIWWSFAWLAFRIAAWLDRDLNDVGRRFNLKETWHLVYTLVSGLGLTLVWLLPLVLKNWLLPLVGFLVILPVVFGPIFPYVAARNQRVLEDMRILTKRHILHVLANLFRKKKEPLHVKLPYEQGPPVVFQSEGPDGNANQVRTIAARNMPGYVPAKSLFEDATLAQADRILMDFTANAVRVQYDIDGIWQPGVSVERQEADQILACLKTLGHANPDDRRSRQTARFSFTYPDPKHKTPVEMITQGTPSGERALLKLDRGMKGLDSLEKIGMRPSQRDVLMPYLKGEHGGAIVLVSAPPAGGFTTTWYATLKSMDRLLRDFVAIEPVQDRTPYVENVEVTTFDPDKGESPDQFLPKIILKQPDVYAVPQLVNAETIKLLCSEVLDEGRLVVAGVRASSAVEAISKVLALNPAKQPFLEALKIVVNVRLIRKLAETCKQPYQPPPQLLQKLGLPADRVRQLYREWQPNPQAPVDKKKLPPNACEICGLVGPSCRGLFYLGRTGLFEVLEVTDELRAAISKTNSLEAWRQVARKQGFRTHQDEGILLVAQGVTSLTELQRVLKPPDPDR